jgi:hypothetical protein
MIFPFNGQEPASPSAPSRNVYFFWLARKLVRHKIWQFLGGSISRVYFFGCTSNPKPDYHKMFSGLDERHEGFMT